MKGLTEELHFRRISCFTHASFFLDGQLSCVATGEQGRKQDPVPPILLRDRVFYTPFSVLVAAVFELRRRPLNHQIRNRITFLHILFAPPWHFRYGATTPTNISAYHLHKVAKKIIRQHLERDLRSGPKFKSAFPVLTLAARGEQNHTCSDRWRATSGQGALPSKCRSIYAHLASSIPARPQQLEEF